MVSACVAHLKIGRAAGGVEKNAAKALHGSTSKGRGLALRARELAI